MSNIINFQYYRQLRKLLEYVLKNEGHHKEFDKITKGWIERELSRKLFKELKAGPWRPDQKSLQEKIREEKTLKALQNEISLLKSKNNQLIKESNAQDAIIEYNKLTINAFSPVQLPKAYTFKKGSKTSESAVLVGSCWHIGEVINKEEMGGLNEYNFDIFLKRLQFLVEKTISFTMENMSAHTFEELHVFLTGDIVSGIIHDELSETNDLNVVEQASLGAFVTAQAILDLARVFPRVILTTVVGNHGRVKKEKYFKHKQTVNWDYVFYNNLALWLKNQPNIKFNIPLSFWAGVEVQGSKFLIQHGDMIKSYMGIPFYGLNREVSKWTEIKASQKDFFQYFIGSHFHTKAVLQSPTGERILNGMLKGADEFSAGLGLYNDPIQLLFGVHKKYGKSWELSINPKYADKEIKESRYHYNRKIPAALQKP